MVGAGRGGGGRGGGGRERGGGRGSGDEVHVGDPWRVRRPLASESVSVEESCCHQQQACATRYGHLADQIPALSALSGTCSDNDDCVSLRWEGKKTEQPLRQSEGITMYK